MKEKKFLIILLVLLGVCVVSVLGGLIGAALGNGLSFILLFGGIGGAIPVCYELYPLVKAHKNNKKDK